MAKRQKGDANALIDTTLCRAYTDDAKKSFEAQLTEERAKAEAHK